MPILPVVVVVAVAATHLNLEGQKLLLPSTIINPIRSEP